jgi:integrase
MAVQRLTKRVVDSLQPGSGDVFTWDDEVRGFGLKITPAGRRVYIAQYRPAGGRRSTTKRITIGAHGTITPEQARVLAKRELAKVAQGHDPAAERAARRAGSTVRELGEAYLADVRIRRKLMTATKYKWIWEKHVLPLFGSKPVASVTTLEIRRLHRSLHKTPYLANRVVALLGGFFSFAANEGARSPHDNPAHGLELYPERARERFLTPKEFARLGDALTRAERSGLPPAPRHRLKPKDPKKAKHTPKNAHVPIPANPFAVAAIRLLALTGCRENEILTLRWDAVDLDRGYLRLADTKTGKSNRPLGAPAAAIIEALPRLVGSPYVLPGTKPNAPLKGIRRLWYAVRYAAALEELRLHDLRHAFASVPASSGESMLVIQHLLGHVRIGTTERYAHLGADPVKRAADKAAGEIASWMQAGATAEQK